MVTAAIACDETHAEIRPTDINYARWQNSRLLRFDMPFHQSQQAVKHGGRGAVTVDKTPRKQIGKQII
jgi:hypothetical protein